MRSDLWLPVAVVVVAAPAHAVTYLTVQQAQEAIFPGAAFTAGFRELGRDQVRRIEELSGTSVPAAKVNMWDVSGGGYFFIDEVIGKHDYITYAVGLDRTGAVQGLEIMDYRETRGDEVRQQAWRETFDGKRYGEPIRLGVDIPNISGATLSCRHITDGVRRILAIYEILVQAKVPE